MVFEPASITPDPRHAYGAKARLPIIDTVRLLQPQLTHREAWGSWTAFQQAKGLPRPPRALIPGRLPISNKRRIASTFVADLEAQAALVMSLPGDASYLRNCAEELLRHFGGDPTLLENLPHAPLEPLMLPPSFETPADPSHDEEADAAHKVVQELSPEAIDASMVFNYGSLSLRGLLDSSGQLWLKGLDVATATGHLEPKRALRDLVAPNRRAKLKDLAHANPCLGLASCLSKAELDTIWVQEAGVWQLLAAADNEAGKAFEAWWSQQIVPRLRGARPCNLAPEPEPTSTFTLQDKLQVDLLQAQIVGQRLENKKRRLELCLLARTSAAELGLPVSGEQLDSERVALRMAVQDAGLPEDRKIDAADYLRLRGHGEAEIKRLQVSFGRLLKKAYAESRGKFPETFAADFGLGDCQVCCYDRRADRALMNAAYQAMTCTTLYKNTVSQERLALNSL